MNAKVVGWIFTLTGLFLMIGIILPNLFSAKSDIAVILGWVLSIVTILFIIHKVKDSGFITWIRSLGTNK